MESKPTTVTILGQQYAVRGGAEPEHVREIAAYVDAQMRSVARDSSQVSSLRVAILAALNIAEELFQERQERRKGQDEFQRRADRLARTLQEQFERL